MSTPKSNKPTAPAGPWREGRPSFKAFYPEIFGLTVLTIAFVALAAKLSCSGETKRPAKDAPKAVSVDAPFFGSVALAQDASIVDESSTEDSAAPADVPLTDVAAPVVAPSTFETAATSGETSSSTAAASVEPASKDVVLPSSGASKSSNRFARILWIWIGCLIIPAILWVWRGWIWLYTVFSVKYKIVCDPDNLKATTFLVVRGLFNKKTDSLHIAQIRDIQSSQTIWQKYAQGGVGTIRLTTSDVSDPNVELKNMEEPSRVFNAFDELRRHYWGRGGMSLNSGFVDSADAVDSGDCEGREF